MRRSGFTLIEILVACSLFLMLVGVAFYILDYGVRASMTSNTRQSLQSEATRTMLLLQNDLRRSHYGGITILPRLKTINGVSVHRDALCFPAVSNWNDAAAYNATYGVPNYDRYIVYYATAEAPRGRVIRSVYPAALINCTVTPLATFSESLYCNDDPNLNPPKVAGGQLGYTVLCPEVREFLALDPGGGMVGARLQLLRPSGVRVATGGKKNSDTSYQMEVQVFPENTWPRE